MACGVPPRSSGRKGSGTQAGRRSARGPREGLTDPGQTTVAVRRPRDSFAEPRTNAELSARPPARHLTDRDSARPEQYLTRCSRRSYSTRKFADISEPLSEEIEQEALGYVGRHRSRRRSSSAARTALSELVIEPRAGIGIAHGGDDARRHRDRRAHPRRRAGDHHRGVKIRSGSGRARPRLDAGTRPARRPPGPRPRSRAGDPLRYRRLKALRKAIGDVFGTRALVHRAIATRSRTSRTPCPRRTATPSAARCGCVGFADADLARQRLALLTSDSTELARRRLLAAGRPRRHADLDAAGIDGRLSRTLGWTNPIESMIEIVRHTQRNVKRWRDGDMRKRWTAAGMLVAEQQ